MSVLSQILPGLREVRTPLAAGYTWLVVLYLSFHQSLPNRISGLPEPVARAVEFLQWRQRDFDELSIAGADDIKKLRANEGRS